MKTLYCLLIILLCASPLYAEQAMVLTEIEKIQENLWYLQKDLAAQKAELGNQQKQIEALAAQNKENLVHLVKRFNAVYELVESQKAEASHVNQDLQDLRDSLASLADGDNTQQGKVLEQANRIQALEGSLKELHSQLATTQASANEAIAEIRQQLEESRSQVATMRQDVGGRVEQIGLWGAGILLILAVILTIGLAFRKSSLKTSSSDLKHPPSHEM